MSLADAAFWAITRPALVGGLVVAVTLAGTVASVLLRERCGLCGERVRVPLEAHQLFNHAGDS